MYTNDVQEILLGARLDISSTGVKASWVPGFSKWKIKAITLSVQNVIGAAGIVRVAYGDLGIATTQGTEAAEFDIASEAAGTVKYVKDLDIDIIPGQEVIVDCSDAAAAGDLCSVSMLAERVDERPGNNSDMVEEAS